MRDFVSDEEIITTKPKFTDGEVRSQASTELKSFLKIVSGILSVLEVIAVDAIAIANEKTWCFLVGEGIDDLLGGPLGAGIRGKIEMDDLPPVMTKNDKDVQDSKRHCGNSKEIAGGDIRNMIGQKSSPSLGWWFSLPDHVFSFGRLIDCLQTASCCRRARISAAAAARPMMKALRNTKMAWMKLMD